MKNQPSGRDSTFEHARQEFNASTWSEENVTVDKTWTKRQKRRDHKETREKNRTNPEGNILSNMMRAPEGAFKQRILKPYTINTAIWETLDMEDSTRTS